MTALQNSPEFNTRWSLKKILYTDPTGKWSVAEGTWKNKSGEQEVVACRWNDDSEYGNGTWFILPKVIADGFLLQLIPE